MWCVIAVLSLCVLLLSMRFEYRLDNIDDVELSNLKRHCALLQERIEVLQDAVGKGFNKLEAYPINLDADGYSQADFSALDATPISDQVNSLE